LSKLDWIKTYRNEFITTLVEASDAWNRGDALRTPSGSMIVSILEVDFETHKAIVRFSGPYEVGMGKYKLTKVE
jgi:hypothetical protein